MAAPDLRRNKRELYRITKQRLVAISSAAVSSMLKENEHAAYILEERQKYARGYIATMEHLAVDNETEGPTSMSTLINEEKQYLTAICDTVFISYVCRYKDCGFYGSQLRLGQRNKPLPFPLFSLCPQVSAMDRTARCD